MGKKTSSVFVRMGGSAAKSTPKEEPKESDPKDVIRERYANNSSAKILSLRQSSENYVTSCTNDLQLSRLALVQLPESLYKKTQLTALDLSYNCLTTLPPALGL